MYKWITNYNNVCDFLTRQRPLCNQNHTHMSISCRTISGSFVKKNMNLHQVYTNVFVLVLDRDHVYMREMPIHGPDISQKTLHHQSLISSFETNTVTLLFTSKCRSQLVWKGSNPSKKTQEKRCDLSMSLKTSQN